MPFLRGGGELGALIRAFDWSRTPLGPLAGWPQSLRTVTSTLLLSPVPIVLLWGEDGVMIYNDAYSGFAGGRHPRLLGSKVREGWPEVAEFNANVMRVGLAGGTLAYKDQELTLHRHGRPEQVWMNLDYSPVLDEAGRPAGVMAIVVETTERIRAERHIRAEQERLRQLFEQAPGLMAMLTGPDHVFEFANPAYMRVVGRRDLIGRTMREALPEMERQGLLTLLDDVYQTGKAFVGTSMKVMLRRQEGGPDEERLLDFVCQPITNAAGRVTGLFIEGHDVTERGQAQEALRENEARLRFLDALGEETAKSADADAILAVTTRMLGRHLDVAGCAYADLDADQDGFTIRGDWSAPGAASIIGHYSLATFGRRAVESLRAGLPLILNDIRAELAPEGAAMSLGIGIAATICMPLVKEGRLTALMAVHDGAPRVWTSNEIALVTEVTERSWAHIERVRSEAEVRAGELRFREELEAKVAERTAALQQSEASIRTIFETSHLYQGLLSADGTLRYANATSLAGIGAQLEDVAGKPFWDTPWFAGTPGLADAVKAATARVTAGGSESITTPLELPTGRRNFEFSLRPVRSETGEVVGIVPEGIDVTARIKAEQALQQAQKMEAIGNLTGGIAHDFNNLLMVVLGSLELLRKRMPDTPGLLRLVDNAREAAKRGSSLTTRMLAFARRQDLKPARIDLRQLVGGMTELLERSLGPMIAIEIDIPEHLSRVETDANQLESALLNLAVNARDALGGEGRITLTAREERVAGSDGPLKPGRYVCLAVADAGEGMDEATLKRATEPFFTTKGVGKGTGLGLSMVHGLAEQSGGTLRLRSRPGAGTVAEIWLPARDPVAADEPRTIPPAAPSGNASTRLSVLAVDDDALVLMNTVAMLEDLGHEVRAASSGAQALELLDEARFDLLVTDHAMPQMTGAQLALQVRTRHAGLPIVLATGYAELPAGLDLDLPRLSKPFSQAELAKAIRRVTSR
ncbi:MAG: chemotaxis protein CheY [Enterovirga sp.]|nr:chemotaxis protein CheY [Enterovirga sp.]